MVLLILVFLSLTLALSPQSQLQGPVKVLKVVDGDTLDLERIGRIRLIGIDAPESTYNRRTSGAQEIRLGLMAKAFTASLVSGKFVWLELDAQQRDKYGRVLVYLYLKDPAGDWAHQGKRYRQVNLEIIRAGWADSLTIAPNVRYAELYVQAARGARAKGLGMWGLEVRLFGPL